MCSSLFPLFSFLSLLLSHLPSAARSLLCRSFSLPALSLPLSSAAALPRSLSSQAAGLSPFRSRSAPRCPRTLPRVLVFDTAARSASGLSRFANSAVREKLLCEGVLLGNPMNDTSDGGRRVLGGSMSQGGGAQARDSIYPSHGVKPRRRGPGSRASIVDSEDPFLAYLIEKHSRHNQAELSDSSMVKPSIHGDAPNLSSHKALTGADSANKKNNRKVL